MSDLLFLYFAGTEARDPASVKVACEVLFPNSRPPTQTSVEGSQKLFSLASAGDADSKRLGPLHREGDASTVGPQHATYSGLTLLQSLIFKITTILLQ